MDGKRWKLEVVGDSSGVSRIVDHQFDHGNCPWQVFFSESLSAREDISSSCVILDIPQQELSPCDVAELAAQKYVIVCIDQEAPFHKELMECGVHDFVRRPVEPPELIMKLRNVRRLLEKHRDAMLDYLTELPNRRALYWHYQKLNQERTVSFFFMDIDNFKDINDTFGHRFGDSVLIEIADELRNLAPRAFISRMGGDEFVLLMEGEYEQVQMEQLAEQILTALRRRYESEHGEKNISASIGMLLNKRTGIPLDIHLARCDQAMYQIKRNGKNRYQIYQE